MFLLSIYSLILVWDICYVQSVLWLNFWNWHLNLLWLSYWTQGLLRPIFSKCSRWNYFFILSFLWWWLVFIRRVRLFCFCRCEALWISVRSQDLILFKQPNDKHKCTSQSWANVSRRLWSNSSCFYFLIQVYSNLF